MNVRSALTILAVLALVITPGEAQDLAKVLIGKWEGEVQTDSGNYPRTLIIKSAGENEGRPILQAEYGGTGDSYGRTQAGVAPVQIAIQMVNGEVILRFYTPDWSPVTLTLHKDGKHLLGSVVARVSSGRHSSRADNSIRLEKVE